MKQVFLPLTLLAALALSACQRELDSPEEQRPAVATETPATPSASAELLPTLGAEPGQLYVRIRPSAQQSVRAFDLRADATGGARALQALPGQLARSLRSLSTESLQPLFPLDPRYARRMRQAGLDRWYVVRFDQKQELANALRQLASVPEIEYAEPVYPMQRPAGKARAVDLPTAQPSAEGVAKLPFNDPLLGDQWHYHNVGKYRRSVAGADIDLFRAWETETGKPQVIVSVVDGGIDITHPDLVDNLYINSAEQNGQEGVDDDGNGFVDDVYGFNFIHNNGKIYPDDESHGTHVAGTIGARTGNGIGVAGVAGGDGKPGTGVRLMSCQVFGGSKEDGNSPNAIVYGANNGAVISQNSWGYPYKAQVKILPQAVKDAIDYFIRYAGCDQDGNQLPTSPMKGGIVIFAAGNDGEDFVAYPAAYDAVVAVSAMAPDWAPAYYTNRGAWVDIMAPGGDAYYPNGEVLSTVSKKILGKEYGYMQGTSMACPHVSGIAALIVSHYGRQGFTAKECRERLLGALKFKNINLTNPKYALRLGKGYIDASAVFATNQHQAPARVASIQVDGVTFSTANLSWLAVADQDDRIATVYRVYLADKAFTEGEAKEHLVSELGGAGIEPGTPIYYPVAGLGEDTEYHVAVEAIDRWGQSSGLTFASFRTKKNSPPAFHLLTEERPWRVSALEKQVVILQVTDADHQQVSIQLSGETRGVSYQRQGDRLTFTLRGVAPVGKYELILTATDELGARTEHRLPFEVYAYQAPAFTASLGHQIVPLGQDLTVDLKTVLSYDPSHKLHYQAQIAEGRLASATVSPEGLLTLHGLQAGETSLALEVSDGIGKPLSVTLPVRVVRDGQSVVYALYPLPVTAELNIALDPSLTEARVELRSLRGVKVLDKTFALQGTGKIRLRTQRLTPGAYLLRIHTAKGDYTRTFVKN